MDVTALFNLSYGLYVIGAKDGTGGAEKFAGCIVNTVTQSTADPVTLTVCINNSSCTNACIKKTKEFSVSILSMQTKQAIISLFGFRSSRDADKFAQTPHSLTPSGLPYLTEGATGYLQCHVIGSVDDYTHTIFVARVQEAENLSKEPPMTYAYYHNILKGKTPKGASSYAAEKDSVHIS